MSEIRLFILAGWVGLLVCPAAPIRADAGPDCRWLPDLRCDRTARPAGFAPTMTMPYLFEDPFVTTEVWVWGLWHDFPESSVFRGGGALAVAAQVRVALTDRLGLLATKDGRIWLHPDNDLLDSEDGYADLGVGLKYALIDRREDGFILTPSLRYEFTQGSDDVLQGNGEGVWIPAVSSGLEVGRSRVLAGVGARLPVDGDAESTSLFYNLQVGLPMGGRWVPFASLNGIHYLDEGDGSHLLKLGSGSRVSLSAVQTLLRTGAFEGLDIVNLGSDGIDGHDFVSWAAGLQVQVRDRLWVGLAYERPLTRRRDIMKQRLQLRVVLGF